MNEPTDRPEQQAARVLADLPDYDAGFLNDWGGGNVDWWQDYLRAEIGRANEAWRENTLAAIARHLAPGDDLVAQAGKYPEILMGYSQGDMAGVMALISRQALHEAADAITALLARVVALTATVADLERQVPRFPDHMAQIVAAKNERLPERLQTLIAAIEAIPEYMRQYQWQADAKQAFGSKWVRAIAGDNGKGAGRQAIAEVVGHIDVADYIAAANPDTVSMLIAEAATLRDRLARMEGALKQITTRGGWPARIANAALTDGGTE